MNLFSTPFNKDQLNGLANLCFDLAKGAFVLALLPAPDIAANPFLRVFNILVELFIGLAFSYAALVLLRIKGQIK